MRKGFTMIELIFVIVILGILAAVAIPRLAATRDDAEVSKAATNLTTIISDLGAYYTSQAKFASTLAGMTNVSVKNGDAGLSGQLIAAGKECLSIELKEAAALTDTVTSDKPAYLLVKSGTNASESICQKVTSNPSVNKILKGKFKYSKVTTDGKGNVQNSEELESGEGEVAISGVSVVF
ncbi:MAG: type II secretion system protein [Campylobacter sp.]